MIKRLLLLTGMLCLTGLCQSVLGQDKPNILWKRTVNSDRVNAIIFNQAGDTIISGSSDRLINFWKASDGTLLRTINQNAEYVHESAIESLSITPDGSRLASATHQLVKLWTLSAGTAKNLTGHADWVVGVAFSPNGQLLASASFDKTVKIWRASDGALVKTIACPRMMRCVAFSPDGTLLAGGGGSGDLFVWRTSDWTKVKNLPGHTSDIYSIIFSPDGTKLATGGYDSTARVWNMPDGSHRFTFSGNGNIYGVAFTPNSQQLAFTDGEGSTIQMYRMTDGAQTRRYTVETPEVQCLAISRAGQLAYGRVDKTVVLATYSSGTQPPPEPQPEPEPTVSWTLDLSTDGAGSVSVDPSPNGPGGTYVQGTVVRVTAQAEQGSAFVGWLGSTSKNPSLTVTMDRDRALIARFLDNHDPTAVLMNSQRQLVAWFLDGMTFHDQLIIRHGTKLDPHSRFIGLADVNNDGSDDIIVQDKLSRLKAWLMNGTEYIGNAFIRDGIRVSPAWTPIGVADLNGDGNSDIILQQSNGRTAAWFLRGTEFTGSKALRDGIPVAKQWILAATGDINNDGTSDLVWQNTTSGAAAIWFMDRTDVISTLTVPNSDPQRYNWHIVTTHDFNNDGHLDLVWQNQADGRIMVWLLDGESYIGTRLVNNASTQKLKLLGIR